MSQYNISEIHCATDKSGDEGSSSTYIQLLSQASTSVTSSSLNTYDKIWLQNTKMTQ